MTPTVAFDTETALIAPGRAAPPLSCLSFQMPGGGAPTLVGTDGAEPGRLFKSWLDDKLTIVGHNVFFDLAVMGAEYPDLVPAIFEAVDEGRIRCTQTLAMLIDIANGCYRGRFDEDGEYVTYTYHLEVLSRRYCERTMKKDGFRLHYEGFRGVPLADWPRTAEHIQQRAAERLPRVSDETAEGRETIRDIQGLLACSPDECISYPKEDAEATLELYLALHEEASSLVFGEVDIMRSQWALHLASVWGLRTDGPSVDRLETETVEALDKRRTSLIEAGLVRKNGVRDTKAAAARMVAVCSDMALPLRKTKKGGVSLAALACEESGDEILKTYAELTSLSAVINKDVKALRTGERLPIHTRFGLADSGRSTSSGPNVQNWKVLPGDGQGIRECFRPREGFVFANADFDQLELRTFAQVQYSLFGSSRLGDVLNSGKDPHTSLACTILGGLSYEEGMRLKASKDAEFAGIRHLAKITNFGLMGGMGIDSFVLQAEKNGVKISAARGKELKCAWFEEWPESKDYLAYISRLTANGRAQIKQLISGRLRGGVTYTSAANGYAQGLGADAAKAAMWEVSKACYVMPSSPLFGSRPVNFVHDEIFTEVPDDDRAHDAACEMARLMVVGANRFLPDCPATADPALMRFLSKGAFAMFDSNGRLVPWAGQQKPKQ